MVTAHRFALFAFTAAFVTIANAGVLYKSIDREGRITFSDVPLEGAVAVQRITTSDSAKPDEAGAPRYLAMADGAEEAVAQANAKLDMAEHALALARGAMVDDSPLSLGGSRLSIADRQLLDFYKRELVSARTQLMRVMQQRNFFAARPLA
jgi:hypothetical protein